MIKFQKKLVSRIRELRKEKEISQLELAKSVGVSRQTIYFFETGKNMPSLTHSFRIAEIFGIPIESIFYFEPIIKDLIGNLKVEELDELSKQIGINTPEILQLRTLNDEKLTNNFKKEDLIKISNALGLNFDDLFTED